MSIPLLQRLVSMSIEVYWKCPGFRCWLCCSVLCSNLSSDCFVGSLDSRYTFQAGAWRRSECRCGQEGRAGKDSVPGVGNALTCCMPWKATEHLVLPATSLQDCGLLQPPSLHVLCSLEGCATPSHNTFDFSSEANSLAKTSWWMMCQQKWNSLAHPVPQMSVQFSVLRCICISVCMYVSIHTQKYVYVYVYIYMYVCTYACIC